ncbi:MAG: 3-oxoadipate enol-lactonase [Alcaligenaceae bacterium]|nr:3-oxoadipate enol-lactonase [Alcaligenaceae bacterium]
MPIAEINTTRIAYSLEGQAGAPVLVLSNSLGTTRDMWQAQAVLQREFRILRYDTRGHGESAVPAGPYTIDQLGRDVVSLLDHLEIAQAAFCGVSMGGVTGQWLGVHAPERVSRLVVANTAARVGTEQAWRDRAALVRAQGLGPIAQATPARWFTPDFIETCSDRVGALLDTLRGLSPEGYAACCEALATADLRTDISRITVPVLVVAGLHDPVTTPADADFIACQIPGAQRVDLPASHLSNIEAAGQFNDALRAFLLA